LAECFNKHILIISAFFAHIPDLLWHSLVYCCIWFFVSSAGNLTAHQSMHLTWLAMHSIFVWTTRFVKKVLCTGCSMALLSITIKAIPTFCHVTRDCTNIIIGTSILPDTVAPVCRNAVPQQKRLREFCFSVFLRD